MPRLSTVVGVGSNAVSAVGVLVIATDCHDVAAMAFEAEDSAGSVAAGYGCFNRGPGASAIGGVKDSRCGAPGAEVDVVIIVAKGDGGSAGGECAFGRKCCGHLVVRQLLPVLAVVGGQDQEFAIDGITERITVVRGSACERVEKKAGAFVGILKHPGLPAVSGLVDA